MTKDEIAVIKKDGSIEEFDEQKIKRVAVATGISEKESERIIKKIREAAEDKMMINSSEIREIFSKELRKIREYSANLYDWYQSVKEREYDHDYAIVTA